MAAIVAGNWRKFESFAWFDKPDDCNEWAIVYDSNRDADSITRANAIEIEKELAPFIESGEAVAETHNHWACGWVSGYRLRGAAIDAYNAICERLDDYPVLDEETLSRIEHDDECEAWENWGRRDFENELEKRAAKFLPFATLEEMTRDEVDTLFYSVLGDLNYGWEHESSGPYLDMGRVLDKVDLAALEWAPLPFRVYRNGEHLTGGVVTGLTWESDCLIYDDIVGKAVDTIIAGEKDFAIGDDYFSIEL